MSSQHYFDTFLQSLRIDYGSLCVIQLVAKLKLPVREAGYSPVSTADITNV
jgi:hypothetical protein